jgi:hypothetical protein
VEEKKMPVVCKKHYENLAKSRQICEIIFNQEFFCLCEELHYIYKTLGLNDPKKEAFQDAYYSFIAYEDCGDIVFKRTLFF